MKVALVGLAYLPACGLSTIIKEEFPGCEVAIYPSDGQGSHDADCHIVSAAALAHMARYLMPRLDRVLLLSTSAKPSSPMSMLSPLANAKEVKHTLHALIGSARAGACRQATNMPLSAREIEVLRLTACGQTSKQIAATLDISQNTVLTHRKNIAAKTGLHTVSAITHFAMVHGLLH